MSTTLLELDEHLLRNIGDWIQHPVTTAVTASSAVVSTHLPNYRSTADYFNGRWIFFDDKANIGVERQISDDDGNATLTVRGGNLATDGANLTTFRIGRYSYAQRIRAITEAVNEIYPALYKGRDDRTLITGNALPNSHFEDWIASTAVPDKYTMSDAQITASAATAAGSTWGGVKAMQTTTGTGGAGKYAYITSKDYPRLLDLAGKTINFKAWAYPQTADDPSLQIYTIQAAGTSTAQTTLVSTTSAPAGAWTKIVAENMTLNTGLVEIQFRFISASASKYIIWDNARAESDVKEYLLPADFKDGAINQIYIQQTGDADDLFSRDWIRVQDGDIVDDGTDKHLRFRQGYTGSRLIRLEGNTPLSAMTTYTDSITIEDRRIPLLIAYAKYKLYQLVPGVPATQDIGRFESAEAKALWEYQRLANLRMPNQPTRLRMRVL